MTNILRTGLTGGLTAIAVAALMPVLAFQRAFAAQSQGSIQGAWRPVSRTIPATTNPGDRSDPFAHLPIGTQTTLQPGLLIFTARHYSRTTDTATTPRPTTPEAPSGKATVEDLQARWGPFQATAGTYELSEGALTLRAMVAKNPAEQRSGNFVRLTVRMDGDPLWLTPIENSAGRIAAGVTTEYVRVE
jgi:hypothetical protein